VAVGRSPRRTATTFGRTHFGGYDSLVGEPNWRRGAGGGAPSACESAGAGRLADGRRYETAVREVRQQGLLDQLNMAGSVPDAATGGTIRTGG